MEIVERVLDRQPCESLEAYTAGGGMTALGSARRVEAHAVIEEVAAAGLRGRGGAGFPTGTKWATVRAGTSPDEPTKVVVNAAEGEPGTLKDRAIILANPYRVLEGALIAAHVMGATEVVVATKEGFGREIDRLESAITELTAAGWCEGVQVRVVGGPSSYLYGEETALLEVIEGRPPFPRVTPPYRRGLDDAGVEEETEQNSAATVELATAGGSPAAPALVDNAETMANIPGIVQNGAAWFRQVGTPESPGTIVCTITGAVKHPGVAEVAMGTPLVEVIELIGGGLRDGLVPLAVLSGVSNPLLLADRWATPVSYEAMEAAGAGLGTGGFIVFDDSASPLAVAAGVARFLAVESCGQCEPCKRDGLAIADTLEAATADGPSESTGPTLVDRLNTVADGARCYLATQQQRVVGSLLQLFPDAVQVGAPPAEPVAIAPLVRIVDGKEEFDPQQAAKQPDWSHDALDSGTVPAAQGPDTSL